MSRADLTQGIDNRGEFYSHHYLDALLATDLKPLLKRWKDDEAANPALKQPPKRLNSLANAYFQARAQASDSLATEADRLDAARELHARLLDALGYQRHPVDVVLDDGDLLPLAHEVRRGGRPALWVLEAPFPPGDGDEDPDPMEQAPLAAQLASDDDDASLPAASWRELLDRVVFRQEEPPDWVLFLGGSEVVLTHAHKWGQGKALAFDLDALFARRQAAAFQAMAGLLHRDALVPGEGTSLHETLEDSSHKHAFAVSTDLREGAQEAIELLGNEAVHYVRTARPSHPDGGRWAFHRIDARDLTRECLVYLYRLIFLFYVESRSEELGVAPMKALSYRTGYSLESLRALETVPLTSPEAQEGFFLHHTLSQLFRLINDGYPVEGEAQSLFGGPSPTNAGDTDFVAGEGASFRIPGLRSRLFDPEATPLLSACKLRNVVLQRVIERLSLSKEGGKHGRGRISYASLGINQLGAVYEGLLSYTGFFAPEPLIEVANAKENGKEGARTWFVPLADRDRYDDDEIVRGADGARVQMPANTFLFRLAGRDREKSASYYTPEVLTRCLVKHTLAERIGTDPEAAGYLPADALLELTICEPAMGSGAFLGEVVNQLATAYLQRKQAELPVHDDPQAGPLNPIPAERYGRELQRVKARIAANQCYGVDLNPLAAELGKVSLWLGVLRPGAPAPFFDARIATGNSLVGARKQVYSTTMLHKRSKRDGDNWLSTAPKDLDGPRRDDEVYHFLLPAEGMAPFDKDKVVKGLCPEETAAIKGWRKGLNNAWTPGEIDVLKRCSAVIDGWWTAHLEARQEALAAVDQADPVWPAALGVAEVDHDEAHFRKAWERHQLGDAAGKKLKQVLDLWCALWFWPVRDAGLLPERGAWLADLRHLVLGEAAADGTAERLAVAEKVAERQRFVHWAWWFPEVFAAGGFDVVVGNPPWIKVQWNESGILSDLDPTLEIRRQSAKQVADLRERTLKDEAALGAYLGEFEELMGLKGALNDVQNYPLLQGVQTNLYKCFLVLAWQVATSAGSVGMLHGLGLLDDAKGGGLREQLFRRLSLLARFQNKLMLFEGVLHTRSYAMTVCRARAGRVNFRMLCNLFHPRTIDESMSHDGRGGVPVIKTTTGSWDLRGHLERVVRIDEPTLAAFADLYDPKGTPSLEARLPVVHSSEILTVLRRLTDAGRKLSTLSGLYFSTEHFHETNQQHDGTISRTSAIPKETAQLVLSGPHFYVATPYYKEPREVCRHHLDYDTIDHGVMSTGYLPRSVYAPAVPANELVRRTPHWRSRPTTSYFRHINRKMVPPTSERTAACAIAPPGPAHIDGVFSICFADEVDLVSFSSLCSSLPIDFFVKASGKTNLREELLGKVPVPRDSTLHQRLRRTLLLNALTSHYAPLWKQLFDACFANDAFSKPDPRLPPWTHLSATWEWHTPLRTPYARRQALVELDALAALALGLSADELCLIYRVQFPVLQQNEADTWYDQRGRIVFTNNRGLNGVGLSRKQWDELKGKQVEPHRFEGVSDPPEWAVDALGPYEAPFDRCDREEDMRQAYEAFVDRGVE